MKSIIKIALDIVTNLLNIFDNMLTEALPTMMNASNKIDFAPKLLEGINKPYQQKITMDTINSKFMWAKIRQLLYQLDHDTKNLPSNLKKNHNYFHHNKEKFRGL